MRAYDWGLATVAGVFALMSGFAGAPLFGDYWPALLAFWAVMTAIFGLLPGTSLSKAVRIGVWGFVYVTTVDSLVVSFSGISIFLGAIGGLASIGIGAVIHSARKALSRR